MPSVPKISIVTVNLNNAQGLRKTIESVLQQDYPFIEYIVIDGKSVDNSSEILEEHYSKIDRVICEKDNGVYEAMNKGIDVSTTDYLLFLNSGDVFHNPHVISHLMKNSNHEDIIYGDINMVNEDKTNRHVIFPDQLAFSFFFINSLPHPCTLIKKNLFEKIGKYRQDIKIVSDWLFFMLAICRYNVSYKHISIIVVDFQLGGLSTTHSNVIKEERNRLLKENFPSFVSDYSHFFDVEKKWNNAKKQIGYRVYQKISKIFGNK